MARTRSRPGSGPPASSATRSVWRASSPSWPRTRPTTSGGRSSPAEWALLLLEGHRQVAAGHLLRSLEPERRGRVVVAQVGAGGGLLRQVGRQVLAGDDRLEVVGKQDTVRADARLVVVHDPPLPALVDEAAVVRVVGRS